VTYPVLEFTHSGSAQMTFRIVPTADGKYGVTMSDTSSSDPVTVCRCETDIAAASIQRLLYTHHMIRARSEQHRLEHPPTGLTDLWEGGLPNWQAEPFLPGDCSRCGRQENVTGYIYKNPSGGYSLVGAFCWSCCEQVSEELQAGKAVE
jgi:hypothetical protein